MEPDFKDICWEYSDEHSRFEPCIRMEQGRHIYLSGKNVRVCFLNGSEYKAIVRTRQEITWDDRDGGRHVKEIHWYLEIQLHETPFRTEVLRDSQFKIAILDA